MKAMCGVAAGLVLMAFAWSYSYPQASLSATESPARLFSASQLPALLSTHDRNLYRDIFALQKQGKWDEADQQISQLTNNKLLGHVLAQRYLHNDYTTTATELTNWLNQYNDHPQAARLQALARKKSPSANAGSQYAQRILQGYGDDSGLAKWKKQSRHAKDWDRGIAAWRAGQYDKAAQIFSSLTRQESLHTWKIAASGFWAWRAYDALGNNKQADKYLNIAASYPRTFYGILARQKLGHSLDLDAQPHALSDSDVLEIMAEDAIRRIIALSRLGAEELAEQEIRQLFYHATSEEKHRLLAIANELNLASVQIAMARHMATQERTLDYARYPIPGWKPYTGFRVEPALIYAMARQESGFRNKAVSHAGALGVMQLMPDTVSKMKQGVNVKLAHASEPATNITLGQRYIEHLLDTPMVENNMFYLLTAYNAGPGRLQQWKKKLDYKNDPLLFIESIPFGETRSYVMQVMTNYWIYSDLIGNTTHSQQALLQNQWPAYEPPATPVAVVSTPAHAG